MNDPLSPEVPSGKVSAAQTLIILVATFGTIFASHRFIFSYDVPCYASPFAYTALHFSAWSMGFSAMFAVMSFIPAAMRQVEDLYPDPEGHGALHARQVYRLAAISNVGHALLLLACGWMFPYENENTWRHFPVAFSIGVIVIFACKFVSWWRHKPYRRVTLEAHALAWVLMAILFAALLLIWTHSYFFFDPVAVVLIHNVSGVAAGLMVGAREQLRGAELKATTADQI